jgi:signal peptidase I
MSTEDDARDVPGQAPQAGAEPTAPEAAPEPTPVEAAPPEEAAPVEHFQAEPLAAEPLASEPETVLTEPELHVHEPMPVDAAPEEAGETVVPEAPAAAVVAPEAAAIAESEPDTVHEDDEDEPVTGKAKNEIVEIGKTIFFALLIAFVLRVLLFQPFTIPSASMEPNLYEGDYIIVSKWSYGYSRYSIPFSLPLFKGRIFGSAPKRGDIIVFKLPRDNHTDYIKRLIGLPGDTVQMKNNQLFINGKATVDLPKGPITIKDAPFGSDAVRVQETLPNGKTFMTQDYGPNNAADNTALYTIPAGCYFMMGDNRDDSVDSRFDPQIPLYGKVKDSCGWDPAVDAALGNGASEAGVGFVPAENLVGKAQVIMFSWNPGARLWNPISWFSKVRLNRFFHSLH